MSSGMGGGLGKSSGMNMGVSGNNDVKDMIVAVMKEMTKQNKFIHKNDIYTMIQGKYSHSDFEKALERLSNDGVIYTAYDKDVYGLEE